MIPAQLQASKRWYGERQLGVVHPVVAVVTVKWARFSSATGAIHEKEGKRDEKGPGRKCAHPVHRNCHGVYNCCTLLCSLYGCLFSLLTRNPPLRASPPRTLQECRGGARREISLRFHGADLIEKERDWVEESGHGIVPARYRSTILEMSRGPRTCTANELLRARDNN